MTEVLSSPSHFSPSPPSSSSSTSPPPLNEHRAPHHSYINLENREEEEEEEEEETFPFLALLVTVFRKYMVSCRTESESMEIGVPTDVRHVAHVTFDRFNGFLGLPVEFEPEVPRRAPSASASVFGVSTESMQCSYDSRGNSVPTILLLMQRRMYDQGGLQAEGIFRINANNSQEDYVRDQLNRGILPDGVEVYCLAGLIKAWFRELPSGVLDPLDPEQVMQCQSEDECAQLVRLLPPAETALLDWAINLMADVVQEEHHNKMNARNVAMVFSPNMTQMADPLTALMYAVQVMNFLRMLIERTLRQREESMIDSSSTSRIEPSDETGNHSPPKPFLANESTQEEEDMEYAFVGCKPVPESPECPTKGDFAVETEADSSQTSFGKVISDENGSLAGENSCKVPKQADAPPKADVPAKTRRYKSVQSSNADTRKGSQKLNVQRMVGGAGAVEKSSGSSIVSRINSRMERVEAWR